MATGGITTLVRSICQSKLPHPNSHDILLLDGQDYKDPENSCVVYKCLVREKGWIRSFLQVLKILKSYDTVFLHSPHPLPGIASFLARKRIFTFQHGLTFGRGTLLRRSVKFIWYYVQIYLISDKVICSTEQAYQKMKHRGIIVPRSKIAIISFGTVAPSNTSEIVIRHNDAELHVGTAGHMVIEKRFDILIKSLYEFDGPKRIVLHLAGDGPEIGRLQELCEGICSPHVEFRFHGWVANMEEFYGGLDLFVFPSRNESFGLVVLEALVRGIPVVVFRDVGGAIELVKDGRNGIILEEPWDLQQFWERAQDEQFLSGLRRGALILRPTEYTLERTRSQLERLASADASE